MSSASSAPNPRSRRPRQPLHRNPLVRAQGRCKSVRHGKGVIRADSHPAQGGDELGEAPGPGAGDVPAADRDLAGGRRAQGLRRSEPPGVAFTGEPPGLGVDDDPPSADP
jgi:hypothetical protein